MRFAMLLVGCVLLTSCSEDRPSPVVTPSKGAVSPEGRLLTLVIKVDGMQRGEGGKT